MGSRVVAKTQDLLLGKDGGVRAHTEEEGDLRWSAFPMMPSATQKAYEWVGKS